MSSPAGSAHPFGGYEGEKEGGDKRRAIIFSIQDKVGSLEDSLKLIKENDVNMNHIESRPSSNPDHAYDFFVSFDSATDEEKIENVIKALVASGSEVSKLDNKSKRKTSGADTVPWFPRKIADLDAFADKVLAYGEALDADHPGFTDPAYRERRAMITDIAKKFRHGDPIAHIEYLPEEIKTWGTVYTKLKALYPTHACKEHNAIFPLLEKFCGYSADNIPQLEDISKFLQQQTGWRLHPVMGLLSSRDFLNGLAFRVFHSTQYIRHHSKPLYTPEPDVCHELLGHVPLFADPDFSSFSHAIGLASLGVSEEDIEHLATMYWFTVEFGLCLEGEERKAYGAGLLSSFGELEYCLSDKPKVLPFNAYQSSRTEYPITKYQPTYFLTTGFQDAKRQVLEFASTLKRPFELRYNPYTQSVEILDTKGSLKDFAHDIQMDMHTLGEAISKLD